MGTFSFEHRSVCCCYCSGHCSRSLLPHRQKWNYRTDIRTKYGLNRSCNTISWMKSRPRHSLASLAGCETCCLHLQDGSLVTSAPPTLRFETGTPWRHDLRHMILKLEFSLRSRTQYYYATKTCVYSKFECIFTSVFLNAISNPAQYAIFFFVTRFSVKHKYVDGIYS
jgi:hypothetical protein